MAPNKTILTVVFLLFVLGCATAVDDCKKEDLEACFKDMIDNTGNITVLCGGVLDEASKCVKKLMDGQCHISQEISDAMKESFQKIEESNEGCKNFSSGSMAKDASTCSKEQINECETIAASTHIKPCRMLDLAVPCYRKMLDNCLDEKVKENGVIILNDLHKNQTQLECCSKEEFELCNEFVSTEITNSTANMENCMNVGPGIKCIQETMRLCEEEEMISQWNQTLQKVQEAKGICMGRGYKISDKGSGITHNPSVFCLLIAFLVSLVPMRV